jgi:hypothetical protein
MFSTSHGRRGRPAARRLQPSDLELHERRLDRFLVTITRSSRICSSEFVGEAIAPVYNFLASTWREACALRISTRAARRGRAICGPAGRS